MTQPNQPIIAANTAEVETEETYAMVLPEPNPQATFAAVWSGAYEGAEEGMRRLWDRLRDAWLKAKEQQSDSKHTRRSYEYASSEWLDFLATLRHPDGHPVKPWEATTDHVRTWQGYLLDDCELSPATVNQRLAACSSFYSFVIRERGLVDGIEVSAFMDATGKTRVNPFSGGNVQRARTKIYGNSRVLSPKESSALLEFLEQKQNTLTGARNNALMITFLLTGYRNHEVVSMKWGNIRPNSKQPGAWVFEWSGKGGKRQNDPFPPRCYHAILHYLKVSGRDPEEMGADDYIFVPVITHNVANLKNVKEAKGHLSEKSAIRILRTVLKKAGVANPDQVRIHDLRHTFAQRYRHANKDMEALRERLHHESLATTGIYAREILDEPIDDYSEKLYQNLRFEF